MPVYARSQYRLIDADSPDAVAHAFATFTLTRTR